MDFGEQCSCESAICDCPFFIGLGSPPNSDTDWYSFKVSDDEKHQKDQPGMLRLADPNKESEEKTDDLSIPALERSQSNLNVPTNKDIHKDILEYLKTRPLKHD